MSGRARYALALALTLFPAQSFAAAKAAWTGAGTMSCADVTTALQQHPEDENLFFSWAQGFMSGLNTELLKRGETDLNELPFDAQKQSLSAYCKSNPHA
ncbi:MAG: HdeA/HdeB family chaperone, partial [Candidatus Binatus sp.]